MERANVYEVNINRTWQIVNTLLQEKVISRYKKTFYEEFRAFLLKLVQLKQNKSYLKLIKNMFNDSRYMMLRFRVQQKAYVRNIQTDQAFQKVLFWPGQRLRRRKLNLE